MKTLLSIFTLSILILFGFDLSPSWAKQKPAVEIYPYDSNVYTSLRQTPENRSYQTAPSYYTQHKSQNNVLLTKPETSLTYQDFVTIADNAVNALIKQRSEHFISLISPNMLRHFGADKIERNVLSTLTPYFDEFKAFDTKMTVAPTRDSWNNEGYSFYQTFKTKSGGTKKFVIQLVIENGRIVVANLTPDISSPYK